VSSVINTNVMSLNSQRNMLKSSGDLASSMQRLSTGLRINSAKDDAAGLAIAQRMTGQIRGMGQATRNANDGISLVQTAEGALQSATDNLQRLRELAVESSNSSNTQTDRDALNAEAQSLLKEINRVASQTQFNGQNLTDGTFTSAVFQIGANQNQSITIASLSNATTAALGDVEVNTLASAALFTDADPAAPTATITTLDAIGAGTLKITDKDGVDHDIGAITEARTAEERIGQVVEAINNSATATGVSAYYDADAQTINLTSSGSFTLTGFTDITTGVADGSSGGDTSGALDSLDIGSYAGANLAIRQIDDALQTINTDRARMGALQSRFESAVTTLSTSSENLSAARSRIQDTDFAAETANLTRAQILQQAGVAMLSQANSAPQTVLSLLKG
jgi:flagellin